MSKTFVEVIVFLTFLLQNKVECTAFNMSTYYRMPPLFAFDDYDYCMEASTTVSTYCLVHADIIPNKSVSLWNEIEEFSSDTKRHFRHDKLIFGLCLEKCKSKINDLSNSITKNRAKIINNKIKVIDDFASFKDRYEGTEYDMLINNCINFEFKAKHGLVLRTELEYCVTNYDEFKTDKLDVIFYLIIGTLIIFCIISSLYDLWLKFTLPLTMQGNQYYMKPVTGKEDSVLTSFSICRNWYRLSMSSNKIYFKDLRCLDSFKFFSISGVILGHTLLGLNTTAISNPQYMENKYYQFGATILTNGTVIIQTFFVISGFLLSIGIHSTLLDSLTLRKILKMIIYRYMRYTPTYIIMLLFHATALVKIQDGPLWMRMAQTERNSCRKNWWANILFINNYITADEPCLQQCWYLAAEFQLFVVNLVLLVIIIKISKLKRIIVWTGLAVSALIPGLVVYINKLDGIFLITNENEKTFHLHDIGYTNFYIPAYTNFGSYFIGLIAGLIFIRLKTIRYNLKKNTTFVVTWWFLHPLALLVLLSGYIFYYFNLPKPSVWAALYAALLRNFWGFYSIFVIIGNSFGIGWIIRDVTCYPAFRILGRLTFGVFLCHTSILCALLGSMRDPIYVSDSIVLTYTLSTLILSYLMAFVLALVVELPISVLSKNIF